MTTVRNMILCAGLAAAFAPAAMAQYAFPTQFASPGDSGSMSTAWRNVNLGTAPAGTYTSYLVVTDWFSVGGTYQYSSEATYALSSLGGAGTTGSSGTAPTGAGTIYRNNGSVAATGSLSSGSSARTNMYWTGNLTTNFVSTGAESLFLNFGQRFASGVNNARWQNVRVILNPSNNVVTNNVGIAAPSSFVDLGNITPGSSITGAPNYFNTGITGSTAAGTPVQWYRFNLQTAISSANALDIDTFGTGAPPTGVDTRLILWQQTANGLVPVGNNDDISGGLYNNASFLSYGNSSTSFGSSGLASENRGYGNPFNYAGTAGAALAVGDYFISVGYYTNNSSSSSSTSAVFTGTGINSVTTTTWSMSTAGTTYGDYILNIRAIPTPGTAGLMGLGMLAAARRRRV